jgi:hypothetical protein
VSELLRDQARSRAPQDKTLPFATMINNHHMEVMFATCWATLPPSALARGGRSPRRGAIASCQSVPTVAG